MAAGDVGASSFEFYEGLRVLIPGAVVLALYAGVASTFELATVHPVDNALAGVLGALFAGLVLLLLDLPRRAAVYSYQSPIALIRSWDDVRPPVGADYRHAYFS